MASSPGFERVLSTIFQAAPQKHNVESWFPAKRCFPLSFSSYPCVTGYPSLWLLPCPGPQQHMKKLWSRLCQRRSGFLGPLGGCLSSHLGPSCPACPGLLWPPFHGPWCEWVEGNRVVKSVWTLVGQDCVSNASCLVTWQTTLLSFLSHSSEMKILIILP